MEVSNTPQDTIENNQVNIGLPPPEPIKRKGYFLPILIAMVVFVVISAGGYFLYQKQLNKTAVTPEQVAQPNPSPNLTSTPSQIKGDYDVVVKLNHASPCNTNTFLKHCKSDIYLKDKKSGQEALFLTTDDVVQNDSRIPVYKNGSVFLVKRTGNDTYPSNDWTDELWMYDSSKQGKKLYAEKGLSYSVDVDAVSVAVIPVSPIDQNIVRIIPIRNSGQPKDYKIDLQSCIPDPKLRQGIGDLVLKDWNTTGTMLWGSFEGEFAVEGCFWKLTIPTNVVSYYPVASGTGPLVALNTEKMVAVYTDHPVFVEVESHNQWVASHPTYSIYLYNIETKQSTKINTFPSIFEPGQISFSGKWVSPTQLVYSTPTGDKTYTLSQ